VSSAGARAGLAGSRSGLWYEFARIVEELRPAWVVVENVASGASRWVDEIVFCLEKLSYETLPIPLSASDVGARHRRERIFIVAHADGDRQSAGSVNGQVAELPSVAGVVAHADSDKLRQQPRRVGGPDGQGASELGDAGAKRDAADAGSAGLQGADPETRPQARPGAAERAWANDAMPEPAVCRVDDGIPRRLDQRLRNQQIQALGNAVVPQCSEVIGWIVRELMEVTP